MYTHNINGHMSLKAASIALTTAAGWSSKGSRPLLFSDSTWAGSGAYGAVALTDMQRQWSSLR